MNRKVALVIVSALLSSFEALGCDLTTGKLVDWRQERIPRQIVEIEIGPAEEKRITYLQKIFADKPYFDYPTELRIDKVFRVPADSTSLYIFRIRDAHDFWIVFVLDEEGSLVDNFSLSSFDMYKDQ